MEIWCDSAQAEVIVPLTKQGWLTGITTNPKILSTQALPAQQQITRLLEIQAGMVAVQVTATNEKDMLAQAQRLHAFNPRLMIKIPVTAIGLKVISQLTMQDIPVLATAVFGAEQFLLAAKMGVHYVAPYLHHMRQQGIDVFEELMLMQQMIHHYGFTTKVMAASIQDHQEIKNLAKLGIAAATLTPACLLEWLQTHPFTLEGTKALNEAWQPFAKEYAGALFACEE